MARRESAINISKATPSAPGNTKRFLILCIAAALITCNSRTGQPEESPIAKTQGMNEAAVDEELDKKVDDYLSAPKPDGYLPRKPDVRREDRPLLPASLDPVDIVIDASGARGIYRPILDEVNAWKSYASFDPDKSPADRYGELFVNRLAPWWEYVRLLAVLGGNYCPQTADACDKRLRTKTHALDPRWECGTTNGDPGVAARYEPVISSRNDGLEVDISLIRASLEEVGRAGLKPHVAIVSAPSIYTGNECHMRRFHWNMEPVRDFDGWMNFVQAVLTDLKDLGIADWRFSVINEPNCLYWRSGIKSSYRGDESDYARQFVSTVRAARRVDQGLRFHAGSFVVFWDRPSNRNLHRYLNALRKELQAEPTVGWEELSFLSFSLYEIPQLSIYGMDEEGFGVLDMYREVAGLSVLPLKISELGIHPNISRPYEEKSDKEILNSWHHASWVAKSLSVLRHHDVRSVAPWVGHLFNKKIEGWAPRPAYFVYLMDSLLAGRIEIVSDGLIPEMRSLRPGLDAPTFVEVPVSGELTPGYLGEGYSYRSVEAMASRREDGGVVRAVLFHHSTIPAFDDDAKVIEESAKVSVRIRGLKTGQYRIMLYGVGAPAPGNGKPERWVRWVGPEKRSRPFAPFFVQTRRVRQGDDLEILTAGSQERFVLPRHAVILIEVRKIEIEERNRVDQINRGSR